MSPNILENKLRRETKQSQAAPTRGLFITQRLHRIEARGKIRRNKSCNRADQEATHTDNYDVSRHNFSRNLSKLVNCRREKLNVKSRGQKIPKLVSVLDEGDAATKTNQGPEKSDNHALRKENPHDLVHLGSECLHHADLTCFLDSCGDQSAHNSKCCNNYNKD